MWCTLVAQTSASKSQQQPRFWVPEASDSNLVDRFRDRQCNTNCTDSTHTSFTSLGPDPLITSRGQRQETLLKQHAAHSCGWQDTALSLPCQSSSAIHGGRFFWVGQHARPSDSTDSCSSSSLLARAWVSQNSVNKLSIHAASACATQLLDQQSSPHSECLGLAPPEGSPSLAEVQQWSLIEGSELGSQLGSQLRSPGKAAEAHAPTPSLQLPRACLDSAPGLGVPVLSTTDVDTWTADCSPEDVDQLLDWAADPELQSSLSKPESNSVAFSMSCSPDGDYSLQLASSQDMRGLGSRLSCSPDAGYSLELSSSQGMQGLNTQPSCSWDTEAFHLDAQACSHDINHDINQQAESFSDGLSYSLFPSMEAFGETASQQLSASNELMSEQQSSGHGSEVCGDPLDQLMESACRSLPEAFGQQSDAVLPLSGTDCSLACLDGSQAGSFGDGQCPQKKRCGRPRVYDLDTPLATGAPKGSGTHAQMKGRGAKPKYICSTPEEAIAKRRKRNRDTATQSYYKRKQRNSELTDQMEQLRQDNAALQSIFGVVQGLTPVDKGRILEQLRAADTAPAAVLQEVQETIAATMYMS